jgi:hypothetical protein
MTFWSVRPSALSLTKPTCLAREVLEDLYMKDNERATKEGVAIQPRPSTADTGNGTNKTNTTWRRLRTLQWNIQGWANVQGQASSETRAGIIQTILEADADVIVLNEYHWDEPEACNQAFEQLLRELGYTTIQCATVFCPTFMATRFQVHQSREIRLSEERSALAMQVVVKNKNSKNGSHYHHNNNHDRDDDDEDLVWLIGTHLDHTDGRQRRKEMQALLQELFHHVPEDEKMILVGDLNQQRQEDYAPDEWNIICEGMNDRRACLDDGVDQLLRDEDFTCAWETVNTTDPTNTTNTTMCNWKTLHPPSTHWSGTIVDYSYGRNVIAEGVSISPAGWSDHRMTVCDWKW